MVDHPTSDTAPTTMRKRRFGLLAATICGVAAIASVGLFGRFDLSIGLDKTWAGPVRFGINGAVGDGLTGVGANGDGVTGNAAATTATVAASHDVRAAGAGTPGRATDADRVALVAAQQDVANATHEAYLAAAAAAGLVEPADTGITESQNYRDAATIMHETAEQIRRRPQ